MRFVRQSLIALAIGSTLLLSVISAQAQAVSSQRRENPYGQIGGALKSIERLSLREVLNEIDKNVAGLQQQTGGAYLRIAELMKRVGDARAEDYYEKAIQADETEPAYELFYADYLRNFRGPQRPLFPRAERHYFRALRKLDELPQKEDWDEITQRRVERGLVALYQEDGLAWLYRNVDDSQTLRQPLASFSTISRAAQLAGDFDNLDDMRALTSEALLSTVRLGGNLSDTQLARMIRRKDQFETLNRVRFRYRSWPVFDLLYKFRAIEQAQITIFNQPNRFNDLNLKEYGFAVEKPFSVSKNLDMYLRGSYKKVIRRGLIEFLPRSVEDVHQYEVRGALSRFFGPDKVVVEAAYVFQDINPQINDPCIFCFNFVNTFEDSPDLRQGRLQPVEIGRDTAKLDPDTRERRIVAATFTYQLLRLSFKSTYRNRFETRGWHFFGGFANDQEIFGLAKVIKNDYFVGTSLRGIGRFDLTLQPTVFTAFVEGDGKSRRENSQYRTNANLLFRIRDEEKMPEAPETKRWLYPAFVHLVVPFKHDLALNGLDKFENYRIGIELQTKLYSTKMGRTTVLAACGYNYQHFYQLNKTLNQFNVSLSMGY